MSSIKQAKLIADALPLEVLGGVIIEAISEYQKCQSKEKKDVLKGHLAMLSLKLEESTAEELDEDINRLEKANKMLTFKKN